MRQARQILILLFLAVVILSPLGVYSHQGEAHKKHPSPEAHNSMTKKDDNAGIKLIQGDYKRRIEPLFKKSCMDCHSAQTNYPWYHKIPGIKQMIDSDIEEARHHLDFTDGYPFKSHASPEEDLDAIAKSVEEKTMPPFSYRLMHLDAAFTDEEKKILLNWVEKSKPLLKK